MHVTNALLLSFDSLVAGIAVAPLVRSAPCRLVAAVLFGVADGAASLLGALVAVPLHGLLVVAPVMPALYGVYLAAASSLAARGLRATDEARSRVGPGRPATPAILGALAVALSVDNLVSSAAADGASVVAVGCASAALMLVGLTVGGRAFAALAGGRRGAWVGVGLMIAACSAVLS